MPIESFIKEYEHQNWYVVSMLPDAMKKDVQVSLYFSVELYKTYVICLDVCNYFGFLNLMPVLLFIYFSLLLIF